MSKSRQLFKTLTAIGLTVAVIAPLAAIAPTPPAIAQTRVRPRDVWQQVYQQVPGLPLENQYVNTQTGEVDPDNTLIARLIRYHLYVKSRPPVYRLDWKLTLADYLNANEIIPELAYPGADVLNTNPMEADKAAIAKLTRAQRMALVDALVRVFNPNAPQAQPPAASTTPSPAPTEPNQPAINIPRPGDAQLLLP